MAFGLTNEFTMIILFVALACLFAANDAVKETLSRGLMYNDDRLIYDVIKRLGSSNYNYQSEDPKDSGSVSGQQFAHDERQNVQATCEPIIQQGSIIKTTESINAGADYIDSVKNVKSNAECLDYCCQNRTCDVAVYQDKDDHYCYLFRCAGQCIFKAHSGYLVSKIKSRKSEHSEEELQNLSSDLAHVAAGEEKKTMDGAAPDVQEKPENVQHVSEQTTQASATTQSESPELVIAPHSVGLGGFCMLSKQCEDPNAVCGRGNCICREDFYNKEGLCRKVCQQLEFECFELGSLTRGPDCIPRSQVCDSYLNCADGTDEINCDSMAANNQQNSWSQQHAGSASSSVKEGSKDGNAADPYTESVVQEAAKDTYQQQDHLQRIDTQNYGQSQAAKEQQHLVSADQQLNMPKPPPPPPPAPKKPDVRPKPIPTQHALAGSEGSMHVNQNLYSGSALSQPARSNPYSDSVENESANPDFKPEHSPDLNINNPRKDIVNPKMNSSPTMTNKINPNLVQQTVPHPHQVKPASQISKANMDSPAELSGQSNEYQSGPHQIPISNGKEENLQQHVLQESVHQAAVPGEQQSNHYPSQFVGSPPVKSHPAAQSPHANSQDTLFRPGPVSHGNDQQNSGNSITRNDNHPGKSFPLSQKPVAPSSSLFLKASKQVGPHSASSESAAGKSRSKSASYGKLRTPSLDQSSLKSHDSLAMPEYSNSQKWLDPSLYMPYSLAEPAPQQQSQSQTAVGNQYFDSSQYYPPYSSDSLDSLPEALLENAGAPDELSQFGGPDVGQGRSLGLSYSSHNSGYQGYPDTPYGGRNSPSVRYDYNGDYRSPAYQDPDFYSSLGSQRFYRPSAGLYEDFPSGVRPPALNDLQKVPGKAPRPTSVAEKIADAANVAHSDNAHDLEPKPHSTKSPPATTASTSKITSAAAASPSPATQKMFPESHGEKKHVFLSSEKVIIASTRTDAEGPIIALSLGLAFTVILLVLVGCRLRNVRHRLRKGRPLHQNEADYLINGMYL